MSGEEIPEEGVQAPERVNWKAHQQMKLLKFYSSRFRNRKIK